MKNILITSCGRRSELIKYFKEQFIEKGNIVVTDCDKLAPAIYYADKYYITSKITSENYINEILEICKKEDINGILSLIDPEIELLGRYKDKLNKLGVMLIASDFQHSSIFFDKYKAYLFFREHGFECAKTYIDISEFKIELEQGLIKFPVFIKPRRGSASLGITKVNNLKYLEILFEIQKDMIIQEFIDGQEYGVDGYIDLISKKIVSIFIKEKIKMRAGETDKGISIKNKELFLIIENLLKLSKLKGPVDIDVFNVNGRWIISEINPRFGGGYPLAYQCGEKFPEYIYNNLKLFGINRDIGNYEEGKYMLKNDTVIII